MFRLWVRHPIRMWWLSQGFCPVCNSSPPDRNCPVCQGSDVYGEFLVPLRKELWLSRFKKWSEDNLHINY